MDSKRPSVATTFHLTNAFSNSNLAQENRSQIKIYLLKYVVCELRRTPLEK